MITFAKVKSVVLENAKRILKVEELGPKTANEAAPFGDDASPLKDMTAIYSGTSESGTKIIIGYINKNQLATPGEKRIYSLRPDGTLSFEVHLKGDGTCEIGGNGDNLVKFTPLDVALQAQDTAINAELIKIATAITTLGGAYVVQPVATDISPAKTLSIKTG